MDVVHFLYGLVFLVGGGFALAIRRDGPALPDWRWLAAFGILHGGAEWCAIAEADLPLATGGALSSCLSAISAVCLMELLRRSLPREGWWRPAGAAAHVLLALAVVAMLVVGQRLDRVVEVLVMPVGGVMAMAALLLAARRTDGIARAALAALAAALLTYAIGEYLLEMAGGFPARAWLGLGLGLACGSGYALALGILSHHLAVEGRPAAFRAMRWRRLAVFLGLAAAVIVAGILLAESAGRREADSRERRQQAALSSLRSAVSELITRGELGASTAALWPEARQAAGDADHPLVRQRLERRFADFGEEHGFSLMFLLDTRGRCTVASASGAELVGRDLSFRSYFQEAILGRAAGFWALGSVTSRRGIYAAVPVPGEEGAPVGVMVVKQDAQLIDGQFAEQPGSLLFSPEGVVFAAADARLLWRTARPLAEAEREALRASRQFGDQAFTPLAERPVTEGGVAVPDCGGVALALAPPGPGGWQVAVGSRDDEGVAHARLAMFAMLAALLAVLSTGFALVTALGDRGFELGIQERLLRGVMTGIDEGIATLVRSHEPGGALRWDIINPAAERLLGAAGMSGHVLRKCMPAWHEDGTASWLERGFEDPADEPVRELAVAGGDGRSRWLRLARSRHADGLILSIADLTDRRRAEEERSRRQAVVRRMLDASPNPMLLLDREGRLRFANHAWEALLGRSLEEIEGQHIGAVVDGQEIGERLVDSIAWIAEQGVGFEWEVGFAGAGGRAFDLLVACRPLSQDDGEVQVLVACSDITDLRTKEEEIRRTRDFMRRVLDQSPVSVVVRDEDGRVIFANQPFRDFAGIIERDDHAVVGHSLRELMPVAEEGISEQESDRGVFAGGPDAEGETRFTDGHGRSRWFHQRKRLLPLPQGGTALLAVGSDITQLKEALEAANHARDRAEAADRAKSEFLANMSHEIRTPMNGVMGMLELLLGTRGLDPEQREYARTAHRSAEALLGLLNDILDWSKIESGRLELEQAPVRVQDLVFDVADLFRARLAGGEVEMAVDVAPGLPIEVQGDPARLRQILINLVGNAVKFTKQGFVLVRARGEGDRLAITVEDSGIGIPAEQQGRLFSPFTQADAAIGRHFGGTGLGLAISRRLAQLMGGDISLRSAPGQGTTFIVEMPLLPVTPPRPFLPRASLAGLRVLVVDDLAVGRAVAAGHLAAIGCQVQEEPSGEAALAALWMAVAEGRPFDAMVTDWRMPGMDGAELVRAVKADPAFAGLTAVMLTAHGQRCDAGSAGDAGCAGYLLKPVRGEVLAGVLAACVERGRAPGPIITRADIEGSGDDVGHGFHLAIRVLLVEDNQVNQVIARAMLERLGAAVTVAGDGEQALAAMEADPSYPLILMDCRMPVLDGFDATTEIRRRESRWGRHPVIVALTANAFDEDRERCLKVGMDDFLTKPLAERTLVECLKRWVEASA